MIVNLSGIVRRALDVFAMYTLRFEFLNLSERCLASLASLFA